MSARRVTCVVAALVAGLFLSAPPAAAAPLKKAAAPRPAPGSVLVAAADLDRARGALERFGARGRRTIHGTGFVRLSVPGGRARALLAALRGVQAVPDFERRAAAAPDDPLLARGRQFHVGPLRLEQAWSITHADGQVIAVLDTGVDAQHPDLAGQVLPGRDFVNDDTDASDDEGHGTAVAGTAAAATGNGVGVAGVAWGAKVLPVKVLDAQGIGLDSEIAEGITWAADQGAHVINLSLGGWGQSAALDAAVAYARGKGSVIVAAAGNEGLVDPVYPAASPGVIAVSATDAGGEFAFFSNFGDWIDIAAPGWRSVTTADDQGIQDYAPATGTSFSAPVVSGAAALVRAASPALDPDAVAARLRSTASDYGPHGIDPYYGHGFLDPAAAVGGGARPASNLPAGDGNGTAARARLIPLNTSVYDGILQQGDVDWFAFDAPSPGPYDFRIQMLHNPVERPDNADLAVEFYGPGGQYLHKVDYFGTGTPEGETVMAPTSGRHYLRVVNFRGSRSSTAAFGYDGYEIEVRTTQVPPLRPFLTTGPYDVQFPQYADSGGAAIADVTGDGRPDVLRATRFAEYEGAPHAWSLLVNPQNQDGWLDSTIDHDPIGVGYAAPMALAAGDLTGDGRADAVVSTYAGLVLFPQKAGGGLDDPRVLGGTDGADMVEIADWDRDGRNDLVWTRTNYLWDGDAGDADGLFVQLNTAGGWQRRQLSATEARSDLAVGDLDGDGRVDVATLESRQSSILGTTVYRQQADGSVAPDPIAREWVNSVAIADVTGDGRQDLLAGLSLDDEDHGVLVYAQTAGGALAAPAEYGVDRVEAIASGDFNGDGRQDVVVWQPGLGGVSLHLQTAAGTLGPRQYHFTPSGGNNRADGLVAGDITGDGVADAVQNNHNYGLVALRRRSATWPLPHWVADASPNDHSRGVATTVKPTVKFGRPLDPASITAATISLVDASTGSAVAATRAYDAATRTVTITPSAALAAGRPYRVRVAGVRDTGGRRMALNPTRSRVEDGERLTLDGPIDEPFDLRFTVGSPPADTTPPDTIGVSGLHGRTRDTNGRFWSFSSEPGATYECQIQSYAWTGCDTKYNSPIMGFEANGTYTVRVRARDGSGNVDPTPATWSWTVDDTIPYPTNNTDVNARPIAGTTGTVSGRSISGLDFTNTRGGWLAPTNPGGKALWYSWTAPETARFAFDTSGSDYETLVGVFEGTTLARQQSVVAGGTGRVAFDAVAGRSYLIGVGGWFDGYADDMDSDGYGEGGHQALSWSQIGTAPSPPPQTVLESRPTDRQPAGSAYVTFSSPTSGATFECRWQDGAWSACTSPYTKSGLADGEYSFGVRAVAGGLTDPTPVEFSFVVDTVSPETTITQAPPATTTATDATIAFTASEPATFQCTFDGTVLADCESPYRVTGLAPGPHSFEVQARDRTSWLDTTPARHEWTVTDGTQPPPPETVIDAGPSGLVASRSATVSFSSPALGATFECRLDAGAWAACTSPKQLTSLGDGPHTFDVRAIAGGQSDPTPASRSWQVDATAPDTTITSGPPSSTAETGGSFTFTATEAGSSFECRLDAGAWAACTSPKTVAGLSSGAHAFEVRATDAAGNADASPARWDWTVTPPPAPDTTIDSGPTGLVASRAATFTFSSVPAGATFECRLDGGAWAACASPAQLSALGDGPHTFDVRAVAAGGTDATPASRTWQVDATPPDTTISSGPPSSTQDTTATFAFDASETPASFECRVDGGAWAACTSPRALSGLAPGAHTFDVRATDAAGNADASPARHEWTVTAPPPPPPGDTAAPDTTIASGPPALTASRSAVLELTASEAGATFECSLDDAGWKPCSSPVALDGLDDGEHRLQARARDAAGNVDATPALRTWRVDATPPQTTISDGPPATTTATTASFSFTASEAPASFECRVDGGGWAACTSPHALTGVGAGAHAFEVRAIDAAGNADASPATREWTVQAPPPPPGDTTPPDTAFASGPAATTLSRRAVFEMTATEAGAAFECSLDGAAWAPCASPYALEGLAIGGHQLRARARDAAGNADPTPAVWAWTVEAEPVVERPVTPPVPPPLPPAEPPAAPSFEDWLRQALEAHPLRVGPGRTGVLRVLSCPDRNDSRFSRDAPCRLSTRATLTVRRADGRLLRRKRLTLAPGRVRTVRLRVPIGSRPVATLRLPGAQVTWTPRLRRR